MKTSRKENVSLVEHIRLLGEQSKYNQQAQDFLAETDTGYNARYVEYGIHFAGDKDKRDIWEIRLRKGKREYVFKYGDSLHNTWERIHKYHPVGSNAEQNAKYLLRQWEDEGYVEPSSKLAEKRQEQQMTPLKEWTTGANIFLPSAYSVLACLQAYEPLSTFDDFIAEFGYTIESKESYESALHAFGKVVKEWTSLLTLYNNEEMEALAEIN